MAKMNRAAFARTKSSKTVTTIKVEGFAVRLTGSPGELTLASISKHATDHVGEVRVTGPKTELESGHVVTVRYELSPTDAAAFIVGEEPDNTPAKGKGKAGAVPATNGAAATA